jgi:hypothetical protein
MIQRQRGVQETETKHANQAIYSGAQPKNNIVEPACRV